MPLAEDPYLFIVGWWMSAVFSSFSNVHFNYSLAGDFDGFSKEKHKTCAFVLYDKECIRLKMREIKIKKFNETQANSPYFHFSNK